MTKEIKHRDQFGEGSSYSEFHRTIDRCYCIDLDCIEWRENRGVVALICTTGRLNDNFHINNSKPFIWKRTELERKIVSEMSEKTGVPAYYVIHDKDLSTFHVHKLPNKEEFVVLNREEYRIWISLL